VNVNVNAMEDYQRSSHCGMHVGNVESTGSKVPANMHRKRKTSRRRKEIQTLTCTRKVYVYTLGGKHGNSN